MVAMNSYITIGEYEFTACHSFETTKSWKNLVQTGLIKLHNIAGLLGAIKVGDPVEIYAWYDAEERVEEFTGYVSEILPTIPVQIKVEDEMWKLKQETVSNSWKSISLRNLLNYLVPGATIDCPEVTLSPFRLNNVTKATALQKLKDEYLMSIYYRNKTLFAGLPYIEKGLPEVVYHFQKNAKAENLVYKNKEDMKLKVKAISVLPDNKHITKEYGDSDGDMITMHWYNKTEAELDRLGKEAASRQKYNGYKGNFRSLGGLPFCDHSYTCWLEDDNYPEREQGVFADLVKTEYGPNGWFRTITPGRRIVA